MTSLAYGLDMPYEVQLEHDAAIAPTYMSILEPQRSPNMHATRHRLATGVHMVSLSYNGAGAATLQHLGGGITNTVEVPAGTAGTPRTSAPIKISVQDSNEYLRVFTPSTGGTERATISVIPAATFDEMAESEQGVSVLSEISNLKTIVEADRSAINAATHQVGRADTAWANRLVKLDGNGKLFIATASIINDSDPVNKSYVDRVAPVPALAGTGSPEGRTAAPVGTVYTDTAATNGAIRWIKTAGTGSTGWEVEYGDTGWRVLETGIMSSGGIQVRRINSTVHAFAGSGTYRAFKLSSTNPVSGVGVIPDGFRSDVRVNFIPVILDRSKTNIGALEVLNSGTVWTRMSSEYTSADESLQSFNTQWVTARPWPTVLPGTPA